MKKTLLTGIAALFLAAGIAYAIRPAPAQEFSLVATAAENG
jgi:hypothetical protein